MLDNHYCMVFDLLDPSPLSLHFKKIDKNQMIPLLKKVTVKLLQALGFLKQQNVIHADLKPENILLESEHNFSSLKIADFGNAFHCVHDEVSLYYDDFELQTLLYRAPEVMFGIPFGTEVDMWSLGCILAELYLGQPLFGYGNKKLVLEQITKVLGPFPRDLCQRGKYFQELKYLTEPGQQKEATMKILKKLRQSSSAVTDFSFASFLSGLLRYNPAERLTPSQAARHPFLASELGFRYLLDNETYPSCHLTREMYGDYGPAIAPQISKRFLSPVALLHRGTSIQPPVELPQGCNGASRHSKMLGHSSRQVAEVLPLKKVTPTSKLRVNEHRGSTRWLDADVDNGPANNSARQLGTNSQNASVHMAVMESHRVAENGHDLADEVNGLYRQIQDENALLEEYPSTSEESDDEHVQSDHAPREWFRFNGTPQNESESSQDSLEGQNNSRHVEINNSHVRQVQVPGTQNLNDLTFSINDEHVENLANNNATDSSMSRRQEKGYFVHGLTDQRFFEKQSARKREFVHQTPRNGRFAHVSGEDRDFVRSKERRRSADNVTPRNEKEEGVMLLTPVNKPESEATGHKTQDIKDKPNLSENDNLHHQGHKGKLIGKCPLGKNYTDNGLFRDKELKETSRRPTTVNAEVQTANRKENVPQGNFSCDRESIGDKKYLFKEHKNNTEPLPPHIGTDEEFPGDKNKVLKDRVKRISLGLSKTDVVNIVNPDKNDVFSQHGTGITKRAQVLTNEYGHDDSARNGKHDSAGCKKRRVKGTAFHNSGNGDACYVAEGKKRKFHHYEQNSTSKLNDTFTVEVKDDRCKVTNFNHFREVKNKLLKKNMKEFSHYPSKNKHVPSRYLTESLVDEKSSEVTNFRELSSNRTSSSESAANSNKILNVYDFHDDSPQKVKRQLIMQESSQTSVSPDNTAIINFASESPRPSSQKKPISQKQNKKRKSKFQVGKCAQPKSCDSVKKEDELASGSSGFKFLPERKGKRMNRKSYLQAKKKIKEQCVEEQSTSQQIDQLGRFSQKGKSGKSRKGQKESYQVVQVVEMSSDEDTVGSPRNKSSVDHIYQGPDDDSLEYGTSSDEAEEEEVDILTMDH
ncbi:uncharacterized protein LOC106157711 [Lingula anatina]|uniref:Uncharacterized protein LOC106157711 n=1 Tax=Lingula anatina TaxID=7574 RepID=A0A1S3HS86_LINAN|nr:uncharacterized protein LOC106157711 [Lingula anatina]|eukprot:XP_013388897.2 uncharacterized protein LOC106157711 [Lingula anatina]